MTITRRFHHWGYRLCQLPLQTDVVPLNLSGVQWRKIYRRFRVDLWGRSLTTCCRPQWKKTEVTSLLALFLAFGVLPSAQAHPTLTTIAKFPISFPKFLTIDGDGNIFGVAFRNYEEKQIPPYNQFVFKVIKGSKTITTLASFGGDDNCSSIAIDHMGNLFGTKDSLGGNSGTVFEITKGSHTITTVASLHAALLASLTVDGAGNLFGTAFNTSHKDLVFEIANGSHTIATLASVHGAFQNSVALDSDGNLYGTAINVTGKVATLHMGGTGL